MLLRNLSELPALLRKNQCLLGLDYGSKVIGVAVSDPNLRIASPVAGLIRKKFAEDAAALSALINERSIGGIVMGLPKNMDGSEGGTAQAARAFMRNLAERGIISQDLPVVFWDERLSTAAVERFLISDDMSRKRRDAVIDKAAAAYILQGALDAIQNMISKDRFE
jgi:putative holliday junction resolvase